MSKTKVIPLLTEKSVREAKKGKYTFLVPGQGESGSIAHEVKRIYDVQPTNVSLIKIAPKVKGVGRRIRIRSGHVKAIVTLKKGQKIADFVVEEKK